MSGRLVGIELEIGSGAEELASELHGMGSRVLPDTSAHEYHCGCSDCDPDEERYNLWTAQEDCTVDGEFISKPLAIYSDEFERAISAMGEALFKSRAVPNMDAGNHIHVDRRDLTAIQHLRVFRLWARYEADTFARLARARFQQVRGYNRPLFPPADDPWGYSPMARMEPDMREAFWTTTSTDDADAMLRYLNPGKGPWLSTSYHGTYEFRLWNTTRTAWRMRMHAAISAAVIDAAVAGVNVKRDDRHILLTHLAPFMDADAIASYRRQMAATA